MPNISKNITSKIIFILRGFTVASASFRAGYVIRGEDAEITDWPFIVCVKRTGLQVCACGGVLLDATHVLTVGHCMDFVSPYVVFILLIFPKLSNRRLQ